MSSLNMTKGTMVRPRGRLSSVSLWQGERGSGDRVSFGDLVGFLEGALGSVVEVVGDKVLVLSKDALGWTFASNLEEVES